MSTRVTARWRATLRPQSAGGRTRALAAILAAAWRSSRVYATFELLRQDPAFHGAREALDLRRAARRDASARAAAALSADRCVRRGRRLRHRSHRASIPACRRWPAWEGTFTVWACWLALYSAVAHGRRTVRTPLVVATAARALVLSARSCARSSSTRAGSYGGLAAQRDRSCSPTTRCPSPFPILLGARGAVAARDRERAACRTGARAAARARGERPPSGARGARADRARAARRRRPPRQRHGRAGRRGAARDGAQPARPRRCSARSRPRAGRRWSSSIGCSAFLRREDQADELAPQPDLAQLPELVAQAAQGRLASPALDRGLAAGAAARRSRSPPTAYPGGAHERRSSTPAGTSADRRRRLRSRRRSRSRCSTTARRRTGPRRTTSAGTA